ncbi:ARM repeat superfamily protein [Perilla frutescens var. frutescens]|nr:ARM repeat superfamily protein [Perilla frutescens var. frutescens]
MEHSDRSTRQKIERNDRWKPPNLGVNNENRVPLPPTAEAAAHASIDYIPSENLKPFQDPNSKIQGLVGGLESKDWLKVCESLNDVRRFTLYHSGLLQPILEKVLLVMVKTIKNPRSALCKTSIMAASDIFNAFGENLLESASDAFSQLLLQLLLKASQDKKFVCEADRALLSMVKSMAPLSLLQKLGAYGGHSNPRDLKSMEEFGLAALIQMASKLLNDKLPEVREAARGVVLSLHRAVTGNEEEKQEFWQNFCQSNLSAIDTLAMVKLVSSL